MGVKGGVVAVNSGDGAGVVAPGGAVSSGGAVSTGGAGVAVGGGVSVGGGVYPGPTIGPMNVIVGCGLAGTVGVALGGGTVAVAPAATTVFTGVASSVTSACGVGVT